MVTNLTPLSQSIKLCNGSSWESIHNLQDDHARCMISADFEGFVTNNDYNGGILRELVTSEAADESDMS